MPPHPRSISGYRSGCPHSSDMFYTKICSGNMRLGNGMFETVHEDLVHPPRVVTEQDRRAQHNRERHLLITKWDDAAMAEWRTRHPEYVIAEYEF
ncbi:Cyanohydrin beta-glucosyltransferase [Hordeum vulgare]|nr:Cyanohydrin beta-glucosyltransferase [Hordeum vulgare]